MKAWTSQYDSDFLDWIMTPLALNPRFLAPHLNVQTTRQIVSFCDSSVVLTKKVFCNLRNLSQGKLHGGWYMKSLILSNIIAAPCSSFDCLCIGRLECYRVGFWQIFFSSVFILGGLEEWVLFLGSGFILFYCIFNLIMHRHSGEGRTVP